MKTSKAETGDGGSNDEVTTQVGQGGQGQVQGGQQNQETQPTLPTIDEKKKDANDTINEVKSIGSAQQYESEIKTPGQWAEKNGIPVAWLKGYKSFRAMTKRYGTNDSEKFITRIEENIGRKVTIDEDAAVGNLFDELDKYRGNQQSNGM